MLPKEGYDVWEGDYVQHVYIHTVVYGASLKTICPCIAIRCGALLQKEFQRTLLLSGRPHQTSQLEAGLITRGCANDPTLMMIIINLSYSRSISDVFMR